MTATTGTETILKACRLPVEARLGVAFKLFDGVVGNERYIKSEISGLHSIKIAITKKRKREKCFFLSKIFRNTGFYLHSMLLLPHPGFSRAL